MPEHTSPSGLRAAQRQLADVSAETDVAAARFHACDHDTVACQTQLARVPAPTGGETERACVVAEMLRHAGCESVSMDDAGNVIASTANADPHSTRAPIVCMAHLDTVFSFDTPLAFSRDGTRISCPGIGDNSRGLATMIALSRELHRLRAEGRHSDRAVQFVATVGEEGLGNLRGARTYFANRHEQSLIAPHAVLVLDGPGDASIVHHALGSRRYRVTFRGAGGHSWADFGAPNAVHAASRAASWLADLPRQISGKVAVSVSGIGGGESMNAIPAQAWFELDVRAGSNVLLMHVDRELRDIVKAAVAAEAMTGTFPFRTRATSAADAFESTIELLGERPSGVLPHEHDLVQLAFEATRRHDIEPHSAIASTDANIPLSMGIPAITIGGGGTGGGAHTVHEWYDNTHGARGVSRAFTILAALTRN